jgi:hypothetical protein
MGANTPPARIPLWVKLAFTAFMAVLVPCYWHLYGPTNFLYFCDVALFLTLASLWTENPVPAGMALVGIFLPQMLWVVDFVGGLCGHYVVNMTNYMFDQNKPLFTRGLSSFHGWLPFFLIWIVWRLGYDRRSLPAWTVLAWVLLLVGYFLLPPPPPVQGHEHEPVNVNYVYGLGDDEPQHWMPPNAWFAVMMVGLPVVFFIPTHLLLCWRIPSPATRRSEDLPLPGPAQTLPAS